MPSPRLALSAAAVAAALAFPAAAAAAPPLNDNYLASTSIVTQQGTVPLEFAERIDTTEATTQPDTFNPNRDGQPFGGGDPEPTSCGAGQPAFGRTAWWDFKPQSAGGVEIRASGGFDVVLAVYEWSEQTSRITRNVRCQNAEVGSESMLLEVSRGTNYTVQVGGLGNTGGALQFRLDYFPDTDGDGVLDGPDKCRTRQGIQAAGGCPPELRATPRIRYDGVAGGIRITSLAIDDVPRGARAEVRCRRCGGKVTARARRAGVLQLRRFVGREVRNGDRIEVRITQPRARSGRFRFGAIGKHYRWPVVGDAIGDRVSRCMNPGSRRAIKCPR